jgi:D-beta-D-heptose 7-phosphate kinase/D-beta-D-heptose 1-phosphate adenosyltransferase
MDTIVIGDIMIDINYYSITTRKAPEKDIPIYKIINTEYILGGAANVAKTLQKLNNNVELISIIGNDNCGEKIKELLDDNNIKNKLIIDRRQTTQKNRIFCENELVNRYDIEDVHDIDSVIEDTIFNYIKSNKNIKCILLSDYDKGLLTYNLCKSIINYSNINDIYVFIDPKVKNNLKYKNCFCLKPNLLEAQLLTNKLEIENIFNTIYEIINPTNLIITNADKGVYINSSELQVQSKKKFKVVDVTGAGDIFISVLSFLYLQTKDILLSSKIANYIASKSIQYIGNYNINKDDIDEYYLYENNIIYENDINKIMLLNKIYPNIIFTNGCFDIFHSAHLGLLNFCKKQEGIIVLGLNSDLSIKKFKGESRPINNLNERINLLNNLNLIDFIIVFDSETPYNILKNLKPTIIVKGGDYNIDNIIGKEFCKEIKLFNYINGISTTNIIKQISDK